MSLRRAHPVNFKPVGLSDAIDGSNAFEGAMSVLTNLVISPTTDGEFVPRQAAAQLSNFSGFTTPAGGTALLVIGTKIYGMIASAKNPGKDEPFCYDTLTSTFQTIANVTAANAPVTQPTTGDWTPPVMIMPTPGRIMITHPGYNGTTTFLGWLDISNFASLPATGTTHTSTLIDALSTNPITAGWTVGMRITGAGIPVNTFIVSMTPTSVTLSQATTTGAAGVALTVVGGTTAAPIYGAGNLNGTPLTAIPTCVGAYSSRAWYGMQNYVIYSDTLNPMQVTAASQALTVGDNQPVTALVGLPLTSQISGGVIQALIVFKGAAALWQITGDAALTTLALNNINGSVGTLAPNTICPTPLGLTYIAPDGLRILNFSANVSEPVGSRGRGVTAPFINAVNPSRMCMAFNADTLRVSVKNGLNTSQTFEEYFYNLTEKTWTGPHSFPAALIQPIYFGSAISFVSFAQGVDAKMFTSNAVPIIGGGYTENGTALSFVWQSCLMPDNMEMAGVQVVETTLALKLSSTLALTVQALNEVGSQLGQATPVGATGSNSLWGSFNWGSASWAGASAPLKQYAINWMTPLVFKQAQFRVTGACIDGFAIGNLRLKHQVLGYALP